MTLRGYPHREIMKILQVSSGFISKWKQAFILKEIEGIKLAYQGSKAYLSSQEKAIVSEILRVAQNDISIVTIIIFSNF